MNYIIIILCCFSFLVLLYYSYRLNKTTDNLNKTKIELHELQELKKGELKDYFKEEWDRQEKFLNDEIAHHKKENQLKLDKLKSDFKVSETELNGILHQLEGLLKEKEKRYNEVNQDLETYKAGKMKEIDGTAAEYEKRRRNLVDQSIDKYRCGRLEVANQKMATTTEEIEKASEELKEILQTLEEERGKRAAINEEILRQRKLEEEQDFYRIQLNPEDKEDIEILRSITPRLRHPEAINKVIWTGYYQKPLAELRKRAGIEGSGVYKITRLKTNEIYIGQARNVSTRWAEHCKAALGVGTLASSQLHRVMQSDGCENFLFELLEETPIDKLKERESYYIDFYDSKTYGLNTIRGEQK